MTDKTLKFNRDERLANILSLFIYRARLSYSFFSLQLYNTSIELRYEGSPTRVMIITHERSITVNLSTRGARSPAMPGAWT